MKKFNVRTQIILLSSLSAVLVLGMNTIPAFAAVGDSVRVVDASGFISSPPIHCSVGLSFDGTHLYWDACESTGTIWITDTAAVPTVVDSRAFSAEIPELPNAMAYDAGRGVTYVATQGSDANGCPIYEIDHQGTFNDLSDDTVTKLFSADVNNVGGTCFIDGLAYNANDPIAAGADALYISGDAQDAIGVYKLDGTFVVLITPSTIVAGAITTSGVAVGGSNLYIANNGGGDVYRASLPGLGLVDQFVSGNDRQEDMECDPNTFAPTEVMWVRTTPQSGVFPNVAIAHEIEPNTCGLGGEQGNPVGGSIIPIDASALLIAGTFTNAIWIAPVLAGAAGTTAFYLKTRKN